MNEMREPDGTTRFLKLTYVDLWLCDSKLIRIGSFLKDVVVYNVILRVNGSWLYNDLAIKEHTTPVVVNGRQG
jgi:hypothetical protein